MIRTLPVGAMLLVLMGCLNGPPDSSGELSPMIRTATTRYVRDLADAADAIATRADANESLSNTEAFTSFQTASREARERFNAAVGGAIDKRSPPSEPIVSAAWREMARGFRLAVR